MTSLAGPSRCIVTDDLGMLTATAPDGSSRTARRFEDGELTSQIARRAFDGGTRSPSAAGSAAISRADVFGRREGSLT